ncbi:uncharacterized protein NEMAJ01_0904 [Nematocida major]|uniref:uncharacterized protein n=1 Tax=Nematocida major TaxID=1912982 RepID=UPI00200811E1|nr:uncharacterized protein NEMAJ01_0904 [Nematocida major]KAH9386008.1 hypothetical protein NEMAJ01_0904 [Nematocida major]
MYSPPTAEEIQERRALFEEFLQGHEQPPIEGNKKEAIEKVFFFNDQQFSEVCEDLKEEILRRSKQEKLEFISKYTLKRNTIREQISLLEEDELKSLVEDTYLVLKHKHAEGPEDELECLNVLVQSLEEIIGKNTASYKGTLKSEDSPSAIIISVEKMKDELEKEAEAEKKIEILLRMIDKQVPDLCIQELLSMIQGQLDIIKAQKQKMGTELHSLRSEINDLYLEKELETDTTVYEETLESILERIVDHFYEIEYTVDKVGVAEIQKHLDLLNEERRKILQITNNAQIEEVGDLKQIKSKEELLSQITKYYTAIATAISN